MRCSPNTVLLLASTLGCCSAWAHTASACSLSEPYQVYGTVLSTDTVQPTLSAATINVRRADSPGSLDTHCGAIGGYSIQIDASDDQTNKADLGFSLSLVDGTVPFQLPPSRVQNTPGNNGDFSSWFYDDGDSFAGTIEVRVVDRAGNISEPVRVRTSGDAVGCGCSTAGSTPLSAAAWLAPVALLAALRRRARHSALRFVPRTSR